MRLEFRIERTIVLICSPALELNNSLDKNKTILCFLKTYHVGKIMKIYFISLNKMKNLKLDNDILQLNILKSYKIELTVFDNSGCIKLPIDFKSSLYIVWS